MTALRASTLGSASAPGAGDAASSITDVAVRWPSVRETIDVLTLNAGYNSAVVVIGASLLGVAAGVIGAFALLRRRALMGDALSHATLPGVAIAFLIGAAVGLPGKSLPLLLAGAAATGVLGAVTVHLITRHSRLREDAAIGAVLSVFFGAGVVLLSYIQSLDVGAQGGLSHFILGQTAAMSAGDAAVIGAVAVVSLGLTLLLFKEFRLVCFDASFAAAQGWPVAAIDLVMMALVVLVTVIGIQAVGLILVVAMIVIPAAAARFWTERLWVMTIGSAAIGGLSGYLGAAASALLPRLPTGSVIVLVAGSLFVLSLFLAPRRGVVARVARLLALRLLVAEQHVLRAMHEAMEEPAPQFDGDIPVTSLAAARSWTPSRLAILLRWLSIQGLVHRAGDVVRLTPRGAAEAARVTRNHRLWEQYLVTHADIAPSHVDQSADMVEHILSPELIAELEAALRSAGRLPAAAPQDDGIAPSVHPLREVAR